MISISGEKGINIIGTGIHIAEGNGTKTVKNMFLTS